MPELVVATFNVHGGVDGWGRKIPVVECVKRLEADVVVLQELFTPDGESGMSQEIAQSTGMQVVEEAPLARAEITPREKALVRKWRPLPVVGPRSAMNVYRIELDGPPRAERSSARVPPRKKSRGTWNVAVLSARPVVSSSVVEIGRLPTDRSKRVAALSEVEAEGKSLTVVGVHMSHLSSGSPIQFRALRRILQRISGPSVVAGDMNLWGPPTSALLRGWRRAVKGTTWPAWRPIAQPDHILVGPGIEVLSGEVAEDSGGSDHLPVRARIRF